MINYNKNNLKIKLFIQSAMFRSLEGMVNRESVRREKQFHHPGWGGGSISE
jgi:hypothetical protein